MKVDGNLKRMLTEKDTERLNRCVFVPEYNYPFAVFTSSTVFVLWTESEPKRIAWVNAFKGIMLGSNESDVAKFEIKKDKNNKFVVDIYECLR